MLILSRNIEESLMIGDDIEVKVMEVKGNHITIGIQAPKDVVILREELYKEQFEEAV